MLDAASVFRQSVWIGFAMRVLLANQDASTRSSLGLLFKAQSDLDVVGPTDEVSQTLLDAETHRPEVVVLDLDLLGEQIEAVIGALRSLDHPPVVVGVSVRAERRQIALDMGVDAFAYKGDPPDRLLATIRGAFDQWSVSHQE
jgi:DNA-binding NarL/FixJ family response regulator